MCSPWMSGWRRSRHSSRAEAGEAKGKRAARAKPKPAIARRVMVGRPSLLGWGQTCGRSAFLPPEAPRRKRLQSPAGEQTRPPDRTGNRGRRLPGGRGNQFTGLGGGPRALLLRSAIEEGKHAEAHHSSPAPFPTHFERTPPMNFGAIPFRSGVRLFVPGRRAGGLWILGLIFLLGAFSPLAPPALAAPVLDGNIDDVIAQANAYIANGTGCGIIINDPAKEICLTDNAIVPCTNNLSTCTAGGLPYYFNGFDQILAVAAVQGTDAWWGIRTNGGQIGDTDGDGTDGKGPCANGPQDPPGIGPGEGYEWDIDKDCDGTTDIIITVSGGSGTHQPSVI